MDIFIGSIAAFLTTVAMIPQLIKVIKTKSTHDISFWYFFILTIWVALWLAYGLMIVDQPLIWANVFSLIMMVLILGYKIKYK